MSHIYQSSLNINGKPAIKAATPEAKNLIAELYSYATGNKVKGCNLFYAYLSNAWLQIEVGKAATLSLFNVAETEKISIEAIKLVRGYVKGKKVEINTTKPKTKTKNQKVAEPVKVEEVETV